MRVGEGEKRGWGDVRKGRWREEGNGEKKELKIMGRLRLYPSPALHITFFSTLRFRDSARIAS